MRQSKTVHCALLGSKTCGEIESVVFGSCLIRPRHPCSQMASSSCDIHLRATGRVGRTDASHFAPWVGDRLANTLMNSTSSTKLRVVQIFFASFCMKRVPFRRSYSTQHTHCAGSTDGTVLSALNTNERVRLHEFHRRFSSKHASAHVLPCSDPIICVVTLYSVPRR